MLRLSCLLCGCVALRITAAVWWSYSYVAFVICAEQHEQDMLEELDRMHEECASLQDDAQVKVVFLPSNNSSM